MVACSVYEQSLPSSPNGNDGGPTATTGDSTTTDSSGSGGAGTGSGGEGGAGGDTSAGTGGDSTTGGMGGGTSSSTGGGGAGDGPATTGQGGSGGSTGTAGAGGSGGSRGGAAGMAGSNGGGGNGGITDAGAEANGTRDTGVSFDAEAGSPIGPQTLPQHGAATLSGAAVAFTSACAADEVIVGFTARAGAWTDSIGAVCAKFVEGAISGVHALPLNGNPDGGAASTLYCPTNSIAAGVVGNSGRSITYRVDEITGVGVVCRDIGNPGNVQIVAVSQAPLDTGDGGASFREDCTVTRWLTSFAGYLDNNTISGQAVVRLGGECNPR